MIRDIIGKVEPRIASAATSPRGNDQVVLETGRDEGLVELGPQEQRSGQEADGDRGGRGEDERYDGFNATTLRNIASGTPVSRSMLNGRRGRRVRRDGDRAATGDRQAEEDHDVASCLYRQEAIGVGLIDERVGRKPTGLEPGDRPPVDGVISRRVQQQRRRRWRERDQREIGQHLPGHRT